MVKILLEGEALLSLRVRRREATVLVLMLNHFQAARLICINLYEPRR
ncbi:MAG: hypothetical protein Q8M93_19735 [Polaromonas sp.]|nr:hypothetical protein [Polaromonas sp.]MDP2451128.1 hypothetical protein [Polaromonas sp.]MDP3249182.1 hypothetical protein [Polaromonas sp.]MDP3756924.1 hypothetical protein [Polaromonas sp.]MDP3825718.1 hypothetical protein [Polaromonas sp.]